MRRFGKEGTQWLKAFHVIFTLMWMGGVAALIAMQQLGNPSSPDMYLMAATDQLMVDRAVIIPGGVGLIADAALYSAFTEIGNPRKIWIRWKWVLSIALVVIGAGFMGCLVESNAAYVATAIAEGTFDAGIYHGNANAISIAGAVQLAMFLLCMHLGITKPKGKKSR